MERGRSFWSVGRWVGPSVVVPSDSCRHYLISDQGKQGGAVASVRKRALGVLMALQFEIFVHGEGKRPSVVAASSDETLRDVLVRAGIISAGETDAILVFVGECDEALREADDVEDGVDQHAPVDAHRTLHALGVRAHHHVHHHRCRHVAVDVNFGGQTKHRRFSPATTIAVVAAWARKKFKLDPASASEFRLQICQQTDKPRDDVHLGELVEAPKCAICFDLVKEVTPQG